MTEYIILQSFAFNLTRAAMAATAALGRRLAPYDITPAQWGVLAGLKDQDGATPTELIVNLERDLPSTLRVIWKLEKKGLVRRENHPADQRSYMLHLTPEGRQLLEQLIPIVQELNQKAYGHIDKDLLQMMTQVHLELRATYDTMDEE